MPSLYAIRSKGQNCMYFVEVVFRAIRFFFRFKSSNAEVCDRQIIGKICNLSWSIDS